MYGYYMDIYDTWTGFFYWIQMLLMPNANGITTNRIKKVGILVA